jgi:uncharacterized membrane protein
MRRSGSELYGDLGLASRTPLVATQTTFIGPLPSPEHLAGYDKIQPGLVERIVSMAEREQQHRHQCEQAALTQDIANHASENRGKARGQHYGLIIGIVAIVTGGVTAVLGAPVTGALIGGGGVVGLVSVFVMGRYLRERPA